MKQKANNVIRIPTSIEGKFFRYWFEFLRPLHKLTPTQIDVITSFVKHRFELSKCISDEDILDKVLMSEDTKKKIIEECEITNAHFQVIMGILRKKNIIVNNKIEPKFIPNVSLEDGSFQLLLFFDLNDKRRNN